MSESSSKKAAVEEKAVSATNTGGRKKIKLKDILFWGVILVAIVAVLGVGFWKSSPKRTLNSFLDAIEAQDEEKAYSYVSKNIKADKLNNIDWFLEDWLFADDLEVVFESDESWRSRVVMTTNDEGEEIAKINKYGFKKLEKKPTTKHLSHHYNGFITATFDEFEDPVIIKLKRDTDDSWSFFDQVFRGWKITNIKYQPLTEEELAEFEYDDEGFEDLEFEIDDEGNVVLPEGMEDFDFEIDDEGLVEGE